jgi:transposase
MSNWLTLQLRKHGLPVVCLDARHAKGALSMQLNKTDAKDAHGLAPVVRTGWFREVAIKSMDAQALRMLLMARAQLVSQRQAVANNIPVLCSTRHHGNIAAIRRFSYHNGYGKQHLRHQRPDRKTGGTVRRDHRDGEADSPAPV